MSNMIQELAMNIDNWVPVREASIDGMNYQILLRCLSKEVQMLHLENVVARLAIAYLLTLSSSVYGWPESYNYISESLIFIL